MADTKTIHCARHGVTSKLWKGLCGEERKPIDAKSTDPNVRALRAALAIPADVCGRAGLEVCARCAHPDHPGARCGTILAEGPNGETKWCTCGAQ